MYRTLIALVAGMLFMSFAGDALAQANTGIHKAGWKITGEGPSSHSYSGSYWSGRSHQTYARQQGEILQSYGAANTAVPKELLQQHTEAIKAASTAAVKDFDRLKAAAADHPAVVKQIEAVQQHHKQVLAMCEMLDAQGKETKDNSLKICECCTTITKELEAAEKKAEALREPLKIAPTIAAPKEEHPKK